MVGPTGIFIHSKSGTVGFPLEVSRNGTVQPTVQWTCHQPSPRRGFLAAMPGLDGGHMYVT